MSYNEAETRFYLIDPVLRDKGYEPGRTLHYMEQRTGKHHESAWGRRLKRALPFLLEETT